MIRKYFKKKQKTELAFDEILLDASNLPSFNVSRMEGRMELPLARRNVYAVALIFILIACGFITKLFQLQIIEGATHAEISERNHIARSLIVAERGAVYDTNDEMLIWNERDTTGEYDFPVRAYTDREGFGQFLGYVSYPKRDSDGFYFRTEYLGRNGFEEAYNDQLQGENGEQLLEINALGEVISAHEVEVAQPGTELTLALDSELSEVMHELIATTTMQNGFRSGAGAMIDVETGEIVALTSYPSYDPEVLADGDDVELIAEYNNDERFPFLNKVVAGLYTPGSIVKPFVAYGALAEGIISPEKVIVSKGQIVVPNRYDPSNPAIFRDWRYGLGAMTIRDAIAYSSNVFMMAIGGGYEDQEGLGITRLSSYYKLFGLGSETGIPLAGEQVGLVPTPEWKTEVFDDDWRLGDTYLTAIGQFGVQVTPLQMLRAYAAIANGGKLITPTVIKGESGSRSDLQLDPESLRVVREGMRRTVIQDGGTARALQRSDVEIAAKSGTAELGTSKAHVNSWVAGFFPYEEPRYAFILMMEYGPRSNMVGASSVMGKVFNWIADNRPEMFESPESEPD